MKLKVNSIVNALELCLSCTIPSIFSNFSILSWSFSVKFLEEMDLFIWYHCWYVIESVLLGPLLLPVTWIDFNSLRPGEWRIYGRISKTSKCSRMFDILKMDLVKHENFCGFWHRVKYVFVVFSLFFFTGRAILMSQPLWKKWASREILPN